MQTLEDVKFLTKELHIKASYAESLEKKIEEYEVVLKRLNDEAAKAQIREALLEEREDELKGELKKKDEEIDHLDFLESRARSGYDDTYERLRRLEKKHWDLQDAHEATHKELVALRRKVERW